MAIFESKKNKTKAVEKSVAKRKESSAEFGIIKNPRITEKSTFISEKGPIYTFDVSVNANESQVKKAISALYGVKPLRVNLLPVRGKKVYRAGIVGKKNSGKKAYVYLSKGDKIEFA